MGDAADDAYDREEELKEIFETEYLTLSDKELFEGTARARNPKIMSIRKCQTGDKGYTQKQRFCLAKWIYENEYN